ncbi:MAG: DUF4838 domain-containing protein [Clostridia bacterium]|nr:DUF4838 domain-containing protein [Clostridia bacterium]
MRITLARIGNHKTVVFAAEELNKYLKLIDPELFIDVRVYEKYDETLEGLLWVGMDDSFTAEMPKVKDASLDDAILINVASSTGVISGNNPRAVLIAVYRFLKELGCAWVRNTSDGEIIPSYTMTPVTTYVCEAASYRHRAICIEGAISFEHIIDMLDWIPKASMNGYYIQFFLPAVFFERWYTHKSNHFLPPEPLDNEAIRGMVVRIKEEIAKRSLLYHAIGHGWTSEPLGFDSAGWHEEDSANIPDEKRVLIAELNGERAFLKGVPMNTNLCYSNPTARKLMTDAVADYCISHPEVKFVHFWLADYPNSFCECEKCRDTLPSDHYVMMLNAIDERLTAAGCDTKVVFLVYYDLLWAPKTEKINNPDRFTMMFAPITRSYAQSFKTVDFSSTETAPFVRNKLIIPANVAENVAHLTNWQKCTGVEDGFDYDYHLMWDHHNDVGYYKVAQTLFDDMQNLDKIGLNGMVSCQLTRASYPTGLPMYMMAEGLWDKECDFEEKSDEYFLSAFGADGLAVKEYLKRLSELIDPNFIRNATPERCEAHKTSIPLAIGTISEFEKTIGVNLDTLDNSNLRKSWEYLSLHAMITKEYGKALILRANGASEEERVAAMEKLCDLINMNEMKLHRVLDCFFYYHRVRYVIAQK